MTLVDQIGHWNSSLLIDSTMGNSEKIVNDPSLKVWVGHFHEEDITGSI
jgi:hypothetical protein